MGIVSNTLGKRVYLDTNIIIYAVEGFPDYADRLKALLEELDATEITAVSSELTIAEVLVKPLKENNAKIVQAYKDFLLPTAVFEVVPISLDILELSADFRAKTKLKLPDAIHLATCQHYKCNSFLTNDDVYKSLRLTEVKILSEIDFK